jgi:glyoxylase-like metal-dependent hydrolase (beta-lactamase superfamily II)
MCPSTCPVQTVYLKGSAMRIAGFAAGAWQTNCWVVSSSRNAECVIIDPGMDALEPLKELLHRDGLKPVAVLVTHGHIDHMWSVYPVAEGYNIPAFVHGADADLLGNPFRALGPQGRAMVEQFGASFVEPSDVRVLEHGTKIDVAGLEFTAAHRPGHTAGSLTFTVTSDQPVMFSGDVLFKNAIGRTDLPSGDPFAMRTSLESLLAQTSDDTIIHPGHGESTVMADERRHNPYLQNLDHVAPLGSK